jgi:hypothetical protein
MPLSADERERLLGLYRQRVDSYPDVDAGFGERWRAWCRTLLTHGGSVVVPPPGPESDLDALLDRAAAFGSTTRFEPRDVNACHENVAVLWIDGEVESIGTGYALSDDGLWRQHSWGVDADGTVVETTAERQAYVGITLPARAPSMQFAGSNAGGHLRTVLARGGPRAEELIGMIRELARTTTAARMDERP